MNQNPITLTLTFTSMAALAAFAAAAAGTPGAAVATIAPAPQPAGRGKEATAKETAAKTPRAAEGNVQPAASQPETVAKSTETPAAGPAAGASTASSPKPADDQPTASAALEYERDVKPLVIRAGGAKGRDAVMALLSKFGVAKGPDVPADKLPAFKGELEALLAA
jgi:hypothetical protein